jgi:hypothetical protein
MNMNQNLKTIIDPAPNEIGSSVYEFLKYLGEPTVIILTGRDRTRTRALVTLLHGNEPSGLMALFNWIKSGDKPAVNTVCVIAAVAAALVEPQFSNRVIEGKRDLNRCFKSPFEIDQEGQLAEKVLKVLKNYQPEAVIDMHNTSGSGPAFAVATYFDAKHDALTSLFTQRLIITDLRLGALMEISEYLCPTVTIECGGRLDDAAHALATEGLRAYFSREQVLSADVADFGLELLKNPVRLELNEACTVMYGNCANSSYDLVLDSGIEHFNSGVTPGGSLLGWVTRGNLGRVFSSKNSSDQCVLDELIYLDGDKLLTAQDLKLFMITTNPEIAKMDCLLYAVRSNGDEITVASRRDHT